MMMRASSLLTAVVLTTLGAAQAASGTSTVAFSLSVGRSCLLVSVSGANVSSALVASQLVLKCNRDSAAPQNPLEVVAAPVADWQLTAHGQSADGGELFTYVDRNLLSGAPAEVNFY